MNVVRKKRNMLNTLLEMKKTYKVLLQVQRMPNHQINWIDRYYDQLKANIVPVNNTDPEHGYLLRYVDNTHGDTHNFKLTVEAIYTVKRRARRNATSGPRSSTIATFSGTDLD